MEIELKLYIFNYEIQVNNKKLSNIGVSVVLTEKFSLNRLIIAVIIRHC